MSELDLLQRPQRGVDEKAVKTALQQLRALADGLDTQQRVIATLRHSLCSLLSIDFGVGSERWRETMIRFGHLRPDGSPYEGDLPYPDPERIQAAFEGAKRDAIFALQELQPADTPLIFGAIPHTDDEGETFSAMIRGIDGSGLVTAHTLIDEGENGFGKVNRTRKARGRIIAWEPCYGEGSASTEVASCDDAEKTYGERITLMRAGNGKISPHISGTDRHLYACASMDSLHHDGILPDPTTVTILDADSMCRDTSVPGGCSRDGQLGFGVGHPGDVDEDARFRRWVRGEKITS